ncbi:MAG TPA: methionyl-tRNA formyltransferase [Candidatus Paceibacterota bacterium]
MRTINFAFFGGEPLAVPTLQKLQSEGITPSLIVSNPDKPRGRNLQVAPPPTAEWAKKHGIPLIQPEKLRKEDIKNNFDFFVVVSYGKIIPKDVLDLAKLGAINVHPSLLPIYRGPSPIVAAILNGDSETGVTLIKIDEEMDHGPILVQEKIPLSGNEFIQDLEESLAELGGKLLVKIIPEFIENKIQTKEQNHSRATYVKKISKADGEISLEDNPEKNWRKFRAYAAWPRVFFFKDGKRIIVTDAVLQNDQFVIKKVLPEGKKEIAWQEFNK